MFSFTYLGDAPLISVDSCPQLGGNINGPSLIRCPDWLDRPPAKYLLYFAHHEGRSIRMATSDHLPGPWKLHQPHPLELENSGFAAAAPAVSDLHSEALGFIDRGADGNYPHIASPDVYIDHQNQQIRLYYHGRMHNGLQRTRVALSANGLDFVAQAGILALPYLRIFPRDDCYYAIAMPARLYRSRDGLGDFEEGPCLSDEPIRHHALLKHQGQWYVFWTRVGDTPERILVSRLETGANWREWRFGETAEVHRAQKQWEGADLPADASNYGDIMQRVNQLRDPAIFEEDGRIYLLYAIAGEQGIAIGELTKT
ncbi:MAG: hypothetical protein GY815_01670 [Gammaproteobacteria bacterium]|nr:hypothetical protein [Gammaproteobacteria bacterium]